MTESVILLWKSRYEQCRSKDIDPVTDPNRIFPAAGDGSCACGSGISDDPPAAGNAEPDECAIVCNLSARYNSGVYRDLLSGFPDYIQSVLQDCITLNELFCKMLFGA